MIPQQSAPPAPSAPSVAPAAPSTVNPNKKKIAPPPVARKSSPIDSIVDDSVLVTKFFKWLVKKTPKERRNRLIEIYLVVLDQEWTTGWRTPPRPDEAARRFKTEIAQFGPHYRAAKALLIPVK